MDSMKSSRFAWLGACSAVAIMVAPVPASAIQENDRSVPALEVIAPNGQSSILIGSVHVPLDGLHQPDVVALMRKAKVLLIESSEKIGPQPKEVSAYMKVSPAALRRPNHVAPWADALNDGQIAHLRRNYHCLATAHGYQGEASQVIDVVLAMNSASFASTVAYAPCSPKASERSRDAMFMDAALAGNVPVDILEANADVEERRKTVPWQVYEDSLYYSFTREGRQVMPRIATALNAGDFDTVYRIAGSGIRSATDSAVFYKTMLHDRNAAWMPALKRYLGNGDAVILVGAAHLSGPDGLVALLRHDGFTVQPVKLSPAP